MQSINSIHRTVTRKRMLQNSSIVFILFTTVSSCTSFLTVDKPDNQVIGSSVFSSDKTAITAINGLYSSIMENGTAFLNGGITVYAGMSSDELYNRVPSEESNQFKSNDISPSNSDNDYKLWRSAYIDIYKINAIIEGCENSKLLSLSKKNTLVGEAKFMRALFYFYLCNLYGKVPLILSTDYSISAAKGREQISIVYETILNDLKEAENLLTVNYPVAARARPNVYAVKALMARIYLYIGEWELAEQKATDVITQNIYALEDSLNDVFKFSSKETILQLLPVNTYFNSTSEGQGFIPTESVSGRPVFPLTTLQFESFEISDKRKLKWVGTKTYQGITYYYPFKYKIKNSTSAPAEYNVLLRLAEQYLIRAEARANRGNLTDAVKDLNKIRFRAGLEEINASIKEALLVDILQERRYELFAELGHRWFDLKRTGKADAVLSIVKGATWQTNDTLYPIPQNERKVNVFLDQNKGYE